MADELNTTTTSDDFVPEIWARNCLLAFTDHTANGALSVATDVSQFLSEGGDIINVPKQIAVSLAAETEGTAIEYSRFCSSVVTLNVNTNKAILVGLTDVLRGQANQDPSVYFTEQMAANAAKNIDASIMGIYASASITVTGVTSANLAEADIRSAKRQMDAANAPKKRFLLVDSQHMDALSAITRFTQADSIGSGAGIIEGIVGRIHGFDVIVSENETGTTDGFKHLLAGVYGQPNPFNNSLQYATMKFRPKLSLVNYFDVPVAGLRVTIDNDNKLGSDGIRGHQKYGVATWRPEWLCNIKVAD